jgi:putative FmdB family regulatory protein
VCSKKNILFKEHVMPVYQFVCRKHGQFEKITIRAEWDDIRCPDCGNKTKVAKKQQLRVKKFFEKFLNI